MRVYISGPIIGWGTYKERFKEAEKELTAAGHIAINPAKMDEVFPNGDADVYMEFNFQLLRLCDAIYMLQGWKQSLGANREYGYALGAKMKIMCEGSWED